MKRFAWIFALSVAAGPADASCTSEAQEKKLDGGALKTFMMKCRMDAVAACDAEAKDKNLAGAEKTSHVNKCLADAVDAVADARPAPQK